MTLLPLEQAIAISLYGYNTSAMERAQKLYDHFDGDCMEVRDMIAIMVSRAGYIATEFPAPTAEIYIKHAIDRYGEEAVDRVTANLGRRA